MKYAYIGAGVTALIATTLLFAAALTVTTTTTAYAQSEEVETPEAIEDTMVEEVEEESVSNFVIVAEECDTYTHLVRRAVLSFGVENNIVMTPELLVAVETQIVNNLQLGNNLQVGSELSIGGGEIQAAIDVVEANGGTAQFSAAADGVDIDAATEAVEGSDAIIEDSEDVDVAQTEGDVEEEPEDSDDENDPEDEPSEEDNENDDEDGDDEDDEDGDSSSTGIWWIAGGVAVAALWYALYRRNES